ncbi:MAG: C39 family peptidase [Caulobacteraceae bacterium]
MGRIVYEVPLVTQGANPICWVACMAMVASERRGYSVGVDHFTGFDPSNASIADPDGGDWAVLYRLLGRAGFNYAALSPNQSEIENTLASVGPFILSHKCAGFPYGAGWVAPKTGVHAVVITGYDSAINGGQCWMNNPWGNKDRAILASAIVAAIVAWQPIAQFQIFYWRG